MSKAWTKVVGCAVVGMMVLTARTAQSASGDRHVKAGGQPIQFCSITGRAQSDQVTFLSHRLTPKEEGQGVSFKLRLVNTSRHDIQVDRLVTSCGCTQVRTTGRTLPCILSPSAGIDIVVLVETRNMGPGRWVKQVIAQDAFGNAMAKLPITIEVPRWVQISPSNVDFGSVAMGAVVTRQVKVVIEAAFARRHPALMLTCSNPAVSLSKTRSKTKLVNGIQAIVDTYEAVIQGEAPGAIEGDFGLVPKPSDTTDASSELTTTFAGGAVAQIRGTGIAPPP